MTSYISDIIDRDLKEIDHLNYDRFIRYIVNKDRVQYFNDFFLNLFSKVNETNNIKCDIPEKIISKIFFSAISLYKYHKHILEINLNQHDKLIHNISKTKRIFVGNHWIFIEGERFTEESRRIASQMNVCF